MKKLNLIACSFYSFFLINHINAANFSVDFFNVGQGNCTIVHFGEKTPPLIVDAGSSSIDQSGVVVGVSEEAAILEEESEREIAALRVAKIGIISEAIKRYTPRNMGAGLPHINVVISHGDIDHCNWMVDLVENSIGTKAKRVRVLLGGSPHDYNGDQLEDVRVFAEKHKRTSPDEKVYVSEYRDAVIPPFVCGEGQCNILAADTATVDKNRHSIVLEVKREPFSVILTGDAPGKVMSEILKTYVPHESGITILQASHHGADTHDSNAPYWFERLKPHFCVISAGSRRDYGHPRQRMLMNALLSPNIQENSIPHFLQYYSDWSFIDLHPKLMEHLTVGRLESDFVIGFTKLGMFSTASQGDIRFENGIFTFTKGLYPRSDTAADVLLLTINFLENYSYLGDSSLLLSFKLPPIKFLSMMDFMNFLEKIPNLISCDLSMADLSDIDVIPDAIINLIGRSNKLSELTLPILLDLPTIRQAWSDKGLKIKNLRFIS